MKKISLALGYNLKGNCFKLSLLLAFFITSPAGAVTSPEGLISQGDRYYAGRAEGNKGNVAAKEPIAKALAAYIEAYEAGAKSPDLAVKILKSSYFYSVNTDIESDEKKAVLQRAIDIGSEMIEKHPDHAALNYQMAGCWGTWGEVNGIIASARKGVADKVKLFAEKVVRLDPALEEGGGFRTMGRLHFKAPYIPFILSWPDKEEAIRFYVKAIERGPQNLTNHLFYAESLYKEKAYKEALDHLEIVLSANLNADRKVENLQDKKDAEALKKEVETSLKRMEAAKAEKKDDGY
ncbi:MAG: hypothetical protein RQ824_03615 [bacterium]|nr:hypothetical protein [bacterium]